MAARIHNRWHRDGRERSTEEVAGAIAFNSWKIAQDKTIYLRGEQFNQRSELQLNITIEYLLFQVQIIDRILHQQVEDEERQQLITALVLRLAELVQENSSESLGEGDYGTPFIQLFNQRATEYAELGFSDTGPSYPFLRHLGSQIQQLMGDEQEQRWIIDQVMDRDGMDVFKRIQSTVNNIL
jgi:hypothetical protein